MNNIAASPAHRAVDRALEVIAYLGAHPGGVSLHDLATATGTPKPTLHRILRSMRERGFAAQPEPGGDYFLGAAAVEAAFRFHAGLDLRRILRPLLVQVQQDAAQTVHLATLDGAEVVYLDKLEADLGIRLSSVVGGRNPAHVTGVGKALLAAQLTGPAAVERWVERFGPLAVRTPHSVATAADLARELEATRARGYAIDDEESEESLLCVAAEVPLVFGPASPPVAISITGLKTRMTALGVERLGTGLLAAVDAFAYRATTDHPTSKEIA
ncbi:MAG: IclR family transcriptional regulator [Amnibacterium sp.]